MKRALFLSLLILFAQYGFSQQRDIQISYKRNPDQSVEFSYKKNKPGSYNIVVSLSNLTNSYDPNYDRVVSGNAGRLFTLKPIEQERPIGFSYSSRYFKGVPDPKFDPQFIYMLPFPKKREVEVLELRSLNEYLGKEKDDMISYGFYAEMRDTVTAVRRGTVIKLVNEFESDSVKEYSFNRESNYMVIEHKDGTYATYRGFGKDSFMVKLGESVDPGAPLGLLGTKFNDKFLLKFFVHYFKSEGVGMERTYKNAYVTPFYMTTEAKRQFKSKTKVVVDWNDEVFYQDYTKGEIKRILKKSKN